MNFDGLGSNLIFVNFFFNLYILLEKGHNDIKKSNSYTQTYKKI